MAMRHRASTYTVAPERRAPDRSSPPQTAGHSLEQLDPGPDLGGWFPDGVTEHLVDRLWAALNPVPLPRVSSLAGWTR